MNNLQINLITNVKLCQLPVGKLLATQPYQASRNYPHNIRRIIDNWNPYLVGVIKVSERDGVYYIIDGKHRCTAARAKFGDNYLMNCELCTHLSYQDDANIFAKQNENVKPLTRYQKLIGLIEAKDADSLNIQNIIQRHGLTLAQDGGDGVIRCIGKIVSAYKTIGRDGFDELIGLIVGAWKGARISLDTQIIGGAAVFYKTYQKTFDRNRFISKLEKVDPVHIIRVGNTDTSAVGDVRYAKVILYEYNRMAKNRLPYQFKG